MVALRVPYKDTIKSIEWCFDNLELTEWSISGIQVNSLKVKLYKTISPYGNGKESSLKKMYSVEGIPVDLSLFIFNNEHDATLFKLAIL